MLFLLRSLARVEFYTDALKEKRLLQPLGGRYWTVCTAFEVNPESRAELSIPSGFMRFWQVNQDYLENQKDHRRCKEGGEGPRLLSNLCLTGIMLPPRAAQSFLVASCKCWTRREEFTSPWSCAKKPSCSRKEELMKSGFIWFYVFWLGFLAPNKCKVRLTLMTWLRHS